MVLLDFLTGMWEDWKPEADKGGAKARGLRRQEAEDVQPAQSDFGRGLPATGVPPPAA